MSDTINTLRYDIIQDARRLQGITGNILTRDYYRKHSKVHSIFRIEFAIMSFVKLRFPA